MGILNSWPVLQRGDVHVWTATAGMRRMLESCLDESERRRANSFRFEEHRLRYILFHGVLREILAGYVAAKPQEITFFANEFGKPFLPELRGGAQLFFNMSHSENLVAVAVTVDRSIGIDVEFVRPITEMDSLAERHFTLPECALLKSVPPNRRQRVFHTCWTRKEAYIKAVGKGLSIPLSSFDASIPQGAAGRALIATEDSPGVEKWWLSDLRMPEGYVGSLVVEGDMPRVTYLRFELV